MNISGIAHQPKNAQDLILDPLRMLPEGSEITVQVAFDQKTGKLGITFNGVFYSADIQKNAKLGEFLKVLIQANADQMLLKILDEKSEVEVFKKKSKDSVLTTNEKQILREALFPKEYSDIKRSKENVTFKEIQLLSDKIKENTKIINNILPETIINTSQLKIPKMESKSIFLNSNNTASLNSSKILLEPNVTDLSFISQNSSTKESSKVTTDVIKSQADIQKQHVLNFLSDLTPPLKEIFKNSFSNPEELYTFIKLILKKQLASSPALMTEEPSKNISNTETQKLISEIIKNIPDVQVEKPLSKSISKKIVSEIIKEDFVRNDILKDKSIVETIQHSLTQMLSVTETLEKLNSQSGYKGEGVYFLLPFFVRPTIRYAESYLQFDEEYENHKQNKKKRPKLLKLKFLLPEIGEISVELLSHGKEVHLNIFVQSEKAKIIFASLKDDFQRVLLGEGIQIKTISTMVMSPKHITPFWVTDEISVEKIA